MLLIFVPILIAFIPRLSTATRAQDRDSTTEKELGLFMIHAAGMQSSGQNIFESFRDIIKTDIFVQLKKEAMLPRQEREVVRKRRTIGSAGGNWAHPPKQEDEGCAHRLRERVPHRR